MIKVFMNEVEIKREFATKESAREYVKSCKKLDKKYKSNNKYRIVGGN